MFLSIPARREHGIGEGGVSDVFSISGDICVSCLYLVCHFYLPTGTNERIQISVFSKMPYLLSR